MPLSLNGFSWILACVLGFAVNTRGEATNRTTPAVQPPDTALRFSANPTTEEFFRAHVFQEPLVLVGGKPTAAENSELAAALLGYAKRSGPDDFSALTDFLTLHPQTPWRAALLTGLGFEYYNTAHYSLAIKSWGDAWALATNATDRAGEALVDRAFGELINMDARLGRMDEIAALLKSTDHRPLLGPARERRAAALGALWNMQNQPGISFRCGPLALRSIRMTLNMDGASDLEILKSASTQKGCSLPQVADLSKKIGLNYQMAFRGTGEFMVPSVVHWKVGHYAALLRRAGDLYELQDPTFGNKTWATREALEAETSGYFLVPGGMLPAGWRTVDEAEGSAVWGKGMTGSNDPQHIAKNDLATGDMCGQNGTGMAVASIHIMDVNLNLRDRPVGYAPPVGPAVFFTVRYNERDVFQPANFAYGNLGPQWTSDWFSYITDNPKNTGADVNLYVGGGGQRTYTGFNTNTQSFAYQQYDRNLLTRTGPGSYQLVSGDGSKMIYSQSDGSAGTARNIFLTQVIDAQGNAATLTYDTNLCPVAITDAIGQVTTLTYGLGSTNVGSGPDAPFVSADPYKLTKVTDPFGRSAIFTYRPQIVGYTVDYPNNIPTYIPNYAWGLGSITDVIGITSQFGYQPVSLQTNLNFVIVNENVNSLTTPYGMTSFLENDNGNTRYLEALFPDGSKERVEYNQMNTNQPLFDPPGTLPAGMNTINGFMQYRDSYYWDRTACAIGYGDYSKARQYHFLHTENLAATSGALESIKMPLESRVWCDYPGQTAGNVITSNTLPAHIGRVLDDGTTQLYTFGYNPFGNVTNVIDPVGRSLSMIYDTNGIDLLEVRQTRVNNELLFKATYNSQHEPLTQTDASGQTTTFTYNARGQMLTETDPKNETTRFDYTSDGYLTNLTGALATNNDKILITYDAHGRPRTLTDVSDHLVTLDYDNLDRITRITFPDATFEQFGYNLLDCVLFTDRAGRQTSFNYDNVRQLTQETDPLGRATYYEWCRCGAPKSIVDAMGRMTSWTTDLQGRQTSKRYPDGSQISYVYENTTSRRREIIDQKHQTTFYTYNLDNTIQALSYGETQNSTPNASFAYDPNYKRLTSMKDGIGTTTYFYQPIISPPSLGAGKLTGINGPLTTGTVSFAYDELGRLKQETDDGDVTVRGFDLAGRLTTVSNVLGLFSYTYDGNSRRLASKSYPNGESMAIIYGNNLQDRLLQQITDRTGSGPLSQFIYGRDVSRGQITNWSQQMDTQSPSLLTLGYDAANQLLSADETHSGLTVNSFGYHYDPAANRLSETVSGSTSTSTYNPLNQLNTAVGASSVAHTNEWDAQNRLTAVVAGNLRTEFAYDGQSHLAYIRQLQNNAEISFRRFVWNHGRICEERDKSGAVITKRFFPQGVRLETGANAGNYYYTRDHLGSIRELTDANGNVRARYAYDPYGRRTKVSGDLDADFGFAGMFWSPEVSLGFTHFRAYDPNLGRWLARDPLKNAEANQGPNLYAYAGNNPVNQVDYLGLASDYFKPGDIMLRPRGDLSLRPTGELSLRPSAQPVNTELDNYIEQLMQELDAKDAVDQLLAQEEADIDLTLPPDLTDPLLETRIPMQTVDPLPVGGIWQHLDPPGEFAPVGLFIQAGITILTMTDCNTVNGILGLVRQGKGGLLNVYEDQQMRQLETAP